MPENRPDASDSPVSCNKGLQCAQLTGKFTPQLNALIADGGNLLMRSHLPVALIAEQCGFVSPFHFSRTFKEHYGLAPLAFRQQAQASSPGAAGR